MELLTIHNHHIIIYSKDSSKINGNFAKKTDAFFKGIYSIESKNSVRKFIQHYKPDIVQIQNLYPLISPSILSVIHDAGIPIVMRLSNYRLVCPNGLLLSHREFCTRCRGGREWWCILKNCEGEIPKSFGYAIRNWVARIFKFYVNNVTVYYAQTDFQRNFMIREGFPEDRIDVIPNMVYVNKNADTILGEKVLFVGRLSTEKGVDVFLDAASKFPDIPFSMAGDNPLMPDLKYNRPSNLEVLGFVNKEELNHHYSTARFIVVPSIWYEGFPNVILEAMKHNKPVICSRIGGLPEIVDDGKTGLLFEPDNVDDLVSKIRFLHNRPELCTKMGQAGRQKVMNEYSPEKYYERLMTVYEKAIGIQRTMSL